MTEEQTPPSQTKDCFPEFEKKQREGIFFLCEWINHAKYKVH
jgi:hypothetical protein